MTNKPAFARILPFVLYVAFLPLGDALAGLEGDVDLRWLYALQVGLAACALLAFRACYEELRGPRALAPAQAALAVGVGLAVFVAWIHLELPWLSFQVGKGFDPRAADGRVLLALAAVRVAGAVLVVPVMEELFWRSFIARWIERQDFLAVDPAALGLRAVLLSSLLFGLEHGLWFAGVLAGLAYCELYRRSANLWSPIIAHGVTNAALGVWVLATGSWRFW